MFKKPHLKVNAHLLVSKSEICLTKGLVGLVYCVSAFEAQGSVFGPPQRGDESDCGGKGGVGCGSVSQQPTATQRSKQISMMNPNAPPPLIAFLLGPTYVTSLSLTSHRYAQNKHPSFQFGIKTTIQLI